MVSRFLVMWELGGFCGGEERVPKGQCMDGGLVCR